MLQIHSIPRRLQRGLRPNLLHARVNSPLLSACSKNQVCIALHQVNVPLQLGENFNSQDESGRPHQHSHNLISCPTTAPPKVRVKPWSVGGLVF